MLQRRALHAKIDGLRPRGLDLGRRLHYIGLGHNAGGVLVLHQFERLVVGGHRLLQQELLRVQRAQLKVILRERGLGRQARRFQVARARFDVCIAGLDRAADVAPNVRHPACLKWQAVTGHHAARYRRRRGLGHGRGRGARSRLRNTSGHAREVTGARRLREGERLAVLRLRPGQILVRHVHLLLQAAEQRVAVHFPPLAARFEIARLGRLPVALLLERGGSLDRGAHVVRPRCAGGERGEQQGRHHAFQVSAFHCVPSRAGCGAAPLPRARRYQRLNRSRYR